MSKRWRDPHETAVLEEVRLFAKDRQQLADWVEMLMRWMSRKQLRKEDTASVFNISAWQDFCREYPAIASDMEKWLEARRDGDETRAQLVHKYAKKRSQEIQQGEARHDEEN